MFEHPRVPERGMEDLKLRMALVAAWRAGRLTDATWLAVERELKASAEAAES